jgi:hypothetical protein
LCADEAEGMQLLKNNEKKTYDAESNTYAKQDGTLASGRGCLDQYELSLGWQA